MSGFVDGPMDQSEFDKDGKIPEPSGGGVFNGDDCPPFSEYRRTSSPNGVKERILQHLPGETPSGEPDQY